PLDARARHAEAVGEVAHRPRHRPPAAAHARARDARGLAVHRFLVEHEVERQELRQQVLEAAQHRLARERECARQRQSHAPVDARHGEGGVLERLHQHAATLGPGCD
ncbi:hypothetical protein RZS08_50660, partial [Arthrospira platensis SPKY1]|nr:hypothetical protein [Arthrospira platensis SPKY1]